MKLKAILLVILLAYGSISMANGFCGYSDTNRLAWDKNFQERIHQFIGDKKATFFYSGAIYKQALDGLGGPPDEITDIGENLRFASACRAHSCMEKSAVIFSCPSDVLAVGILHYDITLENFNPHQATLTIYSDNLTSGMRAAFATWRNKIEKLNDVRVVEEHRTRANKPASEDRHDTE